MNCWVRENIQALARAWPQREPWETDPSSGGSSGAPGLEPGYSAPAPVRGGAGAASPAPCFSNLPLCSQTLPRSAHSSAGCAALSPKLFSISSSSSSTCSIPTAETSNCRQVNSGEPGATHGGKRTARPRGAARMRRPAEVPSDLRGQFLRRPAREALLLLCLRVWKTASLRNLAQTKSSGSSVSLCLSLPPSPASLSLDTPTHVRHTHLVWTKLQLPKPRRPLLAYGIFHSLANNLSSFFSGSTEKMEAVRKELPHHAMTKSTKPLISPPHFITSFHFFSAVDRAFLLSMGNPSTSTWDPKASYILKGITSSVIPSFSTLLNLALIIGSLPGL